MLQGSDVLHNATHDRAANKRANRASDLGRALIELGFVSLGPIHALKTQSSVKPRADSTGVGEAPQTKAADLVEAVGTEVSASRDSLMFAVVTHTAADPVVCLQTILDNGVVVETTMRPVSAPQRPVGSSLFSRLIRWVSGDPPLWPRSSWPPASYFVELVDTRDAHLLLDCHLERTKEAEQRYHTAVPDHHSPDIYQALQLRLRQVIDYRGVWSVVLNVAILVMLLMAVIFIPRSGSLMDILFGLYTGALALLAMGLVNRVVLPELGPRPTAIKTLLERLET